MNDLLPIQLNDLTTRMTRSIDRSLSLHGINLTEFNILRHLYNSGGDQGIRRLDLAEAVHLSPSGITRVLNPMEKIGLIEKLSNQRDARLSLVRLSESGTRVYREALTTYEQASADFFKLLKGKQIAKLQEVIDALTP